MPTFVFSGLQTAAFSGSTHPDALVHVPESFNPERFGLLSYLHGFNNCIENVAAPPPGIHDPPEPTANLIAQLEESGKSALLLLPEIHYHEENSDPGRLGEPQGFLAFFQEVLDRLREKYAPLADISAANVEHTVLVSHSGGYKAAAHIAWVGGLKIHELCLLDSLYGEIELYDQIIGGYVADYIAGERHQRFINLYRDGGTGNHTRAQAHRMREHLEQLGLRQELLCFDDSAGPLTDEDLAYPLLVKRVSTEHSDFGRTYVGTLLRTSHLP